MRHIFISGSAFALMFAGMAPMAAAGASTQICNKSAAYAAPQAPATAQVTIYNGKQHGAAAGHVSNGVRVIRPAPLYNVQQQRILAASLRRAKLEEARLELARDEARFNRAQAAETNARLSAIEAKQAQISERQSRRPQSNRRVFFGNPRFFGRNGFAGNRNFSGAGGGGNFKSKAPQFVPARQRGF